MNRRDFTKLVGAATVGLTVLPSLADAIVISPMPRCNCGGNNDFKTDYSTGRKVEMTTYGGHSMLCGRGYWIDSNGRLPRLTSALCGSCGCSNIELFRVNKWGSGWDFLLNSTRSVSRSRPVWRLPTRGASWGPHSKDGVVQYWEPIQGKPYTHIYCLTCRNYNEEFNYEST